MAALTKPETPALRRIFEDQPLKQLRQQMEDAFQGFFGDAERLNASTEMSPRMDVSETEAAIQIQTDLPGFKPDEVDIEIDDNYVTISGSHVDESKVEDKDRRYHRVERRTGSFSRSVRLPCAVRQEGIEAELKEGVLTVTLPKSEHARRQRIAVKG